MKKSRLIPLLLLAACSTAFTEPSPTIAYLLKTPATMMDIGVLRLRVLLLEWVAQNKGYTDYAVHGVRPHTWATYNGRENKIEISLHYVDNSTEPNDQYRFGVETECRRIVNDLRELLVLQSYEAPFNHVDYGPPFEIARHSLYDEPADMYQEINNITVLKVTYVFGGAHKKGPLMIQCDGKMTDKAISVTK